MNIKLYTFNGDKREINKSLTNEYSLDGTLRNQCSILEPQIMTKTSTVPYNYAYIEKFHRYYFIKRCVQYRNDIYITYFEVDPLKTYEDGIMALSGLVSQLNDSSYLSGSDIVDSRMAHERLDFPKSISLGSYILVAQGGHDNG